jgi:type II secretory pathway pseudopilin PulG
VLYFLYPYFWGSPLGDRKRTLQHPDPLRREFVRAGAARVVLPVRPGFEVRFASYLQDYIVLPTDDKANQTSPYVSIAEEMREFAQTNYPGIVPANPDDRARARPLTSPAQARAWEDIQRIVSAIGKYAEGQKQKKDPSWRGAPAEAEYYPSDAEWSDPTWQAELNQDHPGLPTKDPWGRPYQYRHTGTIAPFSVFSLGRDGVEGGDDEDSDISTESQGNLIATWFEYTPTSGLDIEIDTPVNKIA